MSSRCLHNMANFGPLAAEIHPVVWGNPANLNGFRVLASVTARHSSSRHQPNFAALNRGRHLCSAGRPSRWTLAHILVCFCCVRFSFFSTAPRDERLQNDLFLCRVRRKTLTQSISVIGRVLQMWSSVYFDRLLLALLGKQARLIHWTTYRMSDLLISRLHLA